MVSENSKIILAITGASGSVYAQKLLERLYGLKTRPSEIAVIFSDTAKEIWKYETGKKFEAFPPARVFENSNFFAPFASGSSSYVTMIVCPASMGILGCQWDLR
jgi:4-hydroxy-3-polyprenylbenzoate decarboxylase